MAESIISPILVQAKVARKISHKRDWLNRYKCTHCGEEYLRTHHKAYHTRPMCYTCSQNHRTFKSMGHAANGRTTKLYNCWQNMKARCHNKNKPEYKHYGGRGITVCDQWMTYAGFLQWEKISEWKEGLTLDRIDVNKGYEPSNCRWATREEQGQNRRETKASIEEVRLIRMLRWSNVPPRYISEIVQVPLRTVQRITAYETWRNV